MPDISGGPFREGTRFIPQSRLFSSPSSCYTGFSNTGERNHMETILHQILSFRSERDWERFHVPKNLAESISIEAAELLQLFQWKEAKPASQLRGEDPDLTRRVAEELADLAIYSLYLAHDLGIDMKEAILEKVRQNSKKYPVELSRGNAAKYTELGTPSK